jgi:erythronate-4-phosphate dehydrogenase
MKTSVKIIVDDKIPFLKGALEPYAEVEYHKGSEITSSILKNADALITRTRTKCNKLLLEKSRVKFIATATIGFDHIDTEYCNQAGIRWTNAPGCNSGSVKQYIASVLVSLSMKYNFKFSEKTIGIVGHGNVGSKIVSLASALGMKVLVNDPPLQRKGSSFPYVSLDEIKEKADIITFHVPLNKEGVDKTFYIADDVFMRSLKPDCLIINSSRGEVVNNNALKNALINKLIKGAILDVWEHEPNIDIELLQLVDIATPHIAGYSADGKANGTAMSVQAISDFFGFGLKKWFPVNVPLPENSNIRIDCKDKSIEKILSELILATYNITDDDKRLRKSVETFEQQRGEYPLRREFQNYKVTLVNAEKNIESTIKELGFNI